MAEPGRLGEKIDQNDQNLSARASTMPEERRRRIAQLVREAGSVTVALLEAEFGISPMTARRDLVALEEEGRVRRTHGGAVLPEYAGHEDSFWYRLDEAVEAKERLARAAVELLEPGDSIFLDCSTTCYYFARRILREGPQVTLLTNSVPIMELFMKNEAPRTEVVGVGGLMRKLTLSFVGPHAVQTSSAHSADRAFVSVKGVTREGFLTDPDVLEAEVKRAMIEHSEDPVLLVSGTKFEKRGLSIITHASKLSRALVTGAPEEQLQPLVVAGVEVARV
jgi:DeoR/GlpR family transcriptional regulator of sugar metabolism